MPKVRRGRQSRASTNFPPLPAIPTLMPPPPPLLPAAGLGEQRLAEVQAALAAEAACMAGELQLGHLCETAIELLTAANQPEGHCAFCLEPLLADHLPGGGGGGGAGSAVLRLGCYHCYHL